MFTYERGQRLDLVLRAAKQYATDRDEVARFTFQQVHFAVTKRANLARAWCEFWLAGKGASVRSHRRPPTDGMVAQMMSRMSSMTERDLARAILTDLQA